MNSVPFMGSLRRWVGAKVKIHGASPIRTSGRGSQILACVSARNTVGRGRLLEREDPLSRWEKASVRARFS